MSDHDPTSTAASIATPSGIYDIARIRALIPHRYPFLLIDRVTSIEKGKRITALKNVTINEPFFNGHFPSEPVMPGVLIIEALAQAAAVLAYESVIATDPNKQRIVYLAGIDDARFKKMVVPGDQLILSVEIDRIMRNIGKFKCRATVDGKLATEATLIAALEVG
ncbi:MAG: 3-hydroxyacyl-ACP dehydratase FabZ [Casimicrobium sp.]